ncbi:MAG: polysaccharide biosynthesis tyrosine autokinase [Acidobacteriota bacterium]|nr:polysaccharide biosynthesis tyrosine autokinase [Acidobacteriota bacterium]
MPALERSLDRPLSDIAAKPYGVSANEPTNVRDYLFVILKRKWLILSLVLVITSLVTIQMSRQPSIYEGKTTIRIEPKARSVLQTKDLVINSGTDPNFWGTQLKLLENNSLARQVVLTLDLQHNPNFFGGQAQGGIFASLRRAFARDKNVASPAPAPGELTIVKENDLDNQPLTAEQLAKLEPYEDAIIANETIEPQVGTNLVDIKFRHSDPELAQKIANTLAEVFVNNNLERATTGSNKAEDLLANKIAEFQRQIAHDTEVQLNYAREHNVPLTIDPAKDLDANRLATLSNQLLMAQNERKNLQAAWESAAHSKDRYSVPDVQTSTRIDKLRERISALKEKRDALLVIYTNEWPEVKKLNAQIEPLEAELDKAPEEVVASMKSRYEAALSRERMLEQSYNRQHDATSQQTRYQIEMAAMTQSLETNKQYLNTLLQRQRELEVTRGDRPNEVSISTLSRLPREAIGPARLRNIALAFIASLIAGICLAFLLDFLDDTVKSIDDVDRYIHLPALALIPASRSERPRLRGMAPGSGGAGNESTALAMTDDVRSPLAESYRHLRTSLLLSSAGQPPKTILVTSSQPSEGKTTTAVNTAFMLAQTGAEVLIIDCDLRRPRLHAHFDVPNTSGLTNLLSGDADIEGHLQSYERLPNLKILTSGPVPPNPAELLGSDEMRKLLAVLSTKFTHIIVDSPPAISFTDASILSTMVDGVVLVVHGGRSSRAVVRRAKQQLIDVGAHIFGVVLNNVRLDATDPYYTGYYSNYYYSNPEDDVETPGGGDGANAQAQGSGG